MLSRLSGFSSRAISNWIGGKPISEADQNRVRELTDFCHWLGQVVNPASIPKWLDTPNPAFGGVEAG
jgi:hypothetical protein